MSCEDDGLLPLGHIVVIKRGRHAGSVCAVVGIDKRDGRILIADGDRISAKKPKRKSPRHVDATDAVLTEVAARLARGKSIDDGWLRDILPRLGDNNFTACS
jgi:ribosomal protein L14E/L6E/L27E